MTSKKSSRSTPSKKRWFVYLLECAGGSLYAGCTNDVEKRFAAHASGRGAKYVRSRGAVRIVYREACGGRSEALKREWALKRLTRKAKLALAAGVSRARRTKRASRSRR